MARLWLSNIDSGVSDEEIRAFLQKYGFPSYDAIEHVAEAVSYTHLTLPTTERV